MRKFSIYLIVCFQWLVLLLSSIVIGYSQTADIIQQQFQSYTHKAVQEKIFVHTDRTTYLPGETLWFKAYVVEGSTMQLFDLSKVGYLEIISPEHTPVLQVKFPIENASGTGSITIPSSITSGNYQLRCYTSWMKNFDAAFFFEMPLTIVNPFIPFEPSILAVQNQKYDVQFFPEGGVLVEGLTSKVAFRATTTEGEGIGFSGKIIDQQGREVVSFAPSYAGIGHFSFTPQHGQAYQAVVTDHQGASFTYALPLAQKQGYVMQLVDTTGAALTFQIQAKDMLTEPLSIVYHTRQQWLHVQKVDFTGQQTTVSIPKSMLQEGISHFTLMSPNGRAYCERLYFTYPKRLLPIHTATDKSTYGKREKVSLSLETKDFAAALSVAITLEDGITLPVPFAIESYLWLLSDLKGTVENPQYYFTNVTPQVVEQLDHVMLTHGWRRFNWEQIRKSNLSITHLPEYHGHFIQAQLQGNDTKEIPATDVFLASPEKPARLYVSQMDQNGGIRWEVKDFFGKREIAIQTDLSKDSTKRFMIVNPFSVNYSNRQFKSFSFDTTRRLHLEQRAIDMQTRNAFLPTAFKRAEIALKDTIPFFGKPDETYLLDDYTRFPTMEEVLREYVRAVTVRKPQGRYELRMFDKIIPDMYYRTNPLVLLDGIPVFDVNSIVEFDPLKIRKIEILAGHYTLGAYSAKGIINFSTYNADLAGYELNPNVYVTAYEGLQQAREFYSPKYDIATEANKRRPDFRHLLYWNPTVKTAKDGKVELEFYTSDQVGTYKVDIQGMTVDGTMGSSSSKFTVKDPTL